MARIKYSALVDQINGSIGGTTFQKNQYGFSVRRKPALTRPNKPRQNRQKPMIARATRAWRSMTQTQRDAWATFATNNPQPIHSDPNVAMSGYAIFVRLNVWRQLAELALYTSTPNTSLINLTGIIDQIQVAPAFDNMELSFEIPTPSTAAYALFNISSPLEAGISAVRNRLRTLVVRDLDDSVFNIWDDFVATYGNEPAVGDRLGVNLFIFQIDNGLVERTGEEIITTVS